MQIGEITSDDQFLYATVTMAHGLARKIRVSRGNGSVQIALSPPHAAITWHALRPEIAETIRRALKNTGGGRSRLPQAA